MPPRCYPPDPPRNKGENEIWQALYKGLRDCDVIMTGVRFETKHGDREVDIVVLTPDLGFVAIEVKGGSVFVEDGQWMQWGPQGAHEIDPIQQAVGGKHSLARYLEYHPAWHYGRVRWAHMIAFPDTTLDEDFRAPGVENGLVVLDASELSTAADEVFGRLRMFLANQPLNGPGEDALALAVQLLAPSTDPKERAANARAYREKFVEDLAEDRAVILKALREVRRYEVTGGPGTGKTWMAMELAKMLAVSGKRVAFLCYSKGLATYVHRETSKWGRKKAPALVSTFHALATTYGITVEPGDQADYWEVVLPDLIAKAALNQDHGLKFDAIVVDESQDFSENWWTAVLNMLRAEPGLYLFGDKTQRVFNRINDSHVDLVPILLDQNIRNTRQIGLALNRLNNEKMRLLGGEGADVRWVECSMEDAYGVASDQIDPLLTEGWGTKDIALLTTKSKHPIQAEQIAAGRDNYWELLFEGDDVFYSTVSGFKGLERPVVVLAIDGFHDGVKDSDVLYVGMSRARDLLVVCGPAEYRKTLLGQ